MIVIDHHRIQEQANTLAVWSQEFCGAGLAALFAMTLAQRAGWKDERVERLQAAMSQYAAIASVADCVPLQNGTRTLARLGMRELARTENCGLRELLRMSCADPANPDSNDLAFGVAPRINAAGRIDHPARALSVFEAARDEEAAKRAVETLNELNQQRRQLVAGHFGGVCAEVPTPAPPALVLYREAFPKGIAGLLAAKCVERFKVPTIVLAPAPEPGLVVGSGRSVAGFDLAGALEQFRGFFKRFGGHAQAVGLRKAPARQIEFEDMLAKRQINLRRSEATQPVFEEKDFTCYAEDEIRAFAFDIRKLLLTGRRRHLAICPRCQRRLEHWTGLVERFDQAIPLHDGKADA
ncbi:MAG: DHHA1 domain-containing protein [Acidobacteriaceae bacterium]